MNQVTDQTFKGAVVGLASWGLAKIDPQLALMASPVLMGLMAIISTKLGATNAAVLFDKAPDNAGE